MTIITRLAHSDTIVDRAAALIPWMQQRADTLDSDAAFPDEEIATLHEIGVLALPLPAERDFRDEDLPSAIDQLAEVLIRIGEGNLAVGRIVEAHFNARHLIARYGSSKQQSQASADVRKGHLFALWVTDPAEQDLQMTPTRNGIRLNGGKIFCSAAGYATRALVTATNDAGATHMLVLPLGNGERVRPLVSPLQGMRAAVTGAVDFSGYTATHEAILGSPGDYMKEPDFSAGAWRASAVASGGLRSLIDLTAKQLSAADRLDSPHHLQRIGSVMIAGETSRLWIREAARTAEARRGDPGQAVAYVGLARIAIESACLDAISLIQRSLGLSAFRRGNPVERICRDLATYLRQPAPDEVLTGAAAFYARRPVPDQT